MKIKYTREQFNNLRVLICLRPMTYASKQYTPGDLFPVPKGDKKAITKARQLYQMRKLDYKGNYTAKEIKRIKADHMLKMPKVEKEQPEIITRTLDMASITTSTSI